MLDARRVKLPQCWSCVNVTIYLMSFICCFFVINNPDLTEGKLVKTYYVFGTQL